MLLLVLLSVVAAHHASSSRRFAALAFDCVRVTGPAYFSHVVHEVADISGRSGLRAAV